VVITVAMHAAGFAVLLRAIVRSHALDRSGFRFVYPSLIILTCWLILIHLLEVSVWGGGYGDLVLSKPWRMLAPLEALTGTLMFGLSTGLFFAIVHRWISNWMQRGTASAPHSAAPMEKRGVAITNEGP